MCTQLSFITCSSKFRQRNSGKYWCIIQADILVLVTDKLSLNFAFLQHFIGLYMLRFALAKQTTTQQKLARQFFRKMDLSLYWKCCVWEGVGDRTELQHIDPPTLLAITAFLSRSPGLLNRGPGGPASLGYVPQSSIFSSTATAQSGVSRAPSAECCFLYSIISPTPQTSCAPSYIIALRPLNLFP